ncbi:hypothetical protein AB205_0217100 [Aquarana catesbeiana]|uniref:Uncharacterized protein n=1 Tax=Aquarana catesbeiana TaxID=8400 RepID=A0A2G9QBS0_AQUCT|nr:hypothetical protein AB205_0217100 [Aquarana catesbeiana]
MGCNRDLENIKQNINDVQNKMKNIIDVLGRIQNTQKSLTYFCFLLIFF